MKNGWQMTFDEFHTHFPIKEQTLKSLDGRLTWLKERISTKAQDPGCPLVISTIHSSKGLEYDNVFLIDCIDGIFPAEIPNKPKINKKTNRFDSVSPKWETYEEERRMFSLRMLHEIGVLRVRQD